MKNPFSNSGVYRYYLAYELLGNCKKVLDIGCGVGRFIGKLNRTSERFGCDVSTTFLDVARRKFPDVDFRLIDPHKSLPYKGSFADAVTVLEVIEHVPDPEILIKDLHRVLRRNGVLILSTPHQGLTGWVDWGNLKFKYPKLHKALTILFKGQNYYRDNYDSGAHGDMSWNLHNHHHFTFDELKDLLEDYFEIEESITYGLFLPLLLPLRDLWGIFFKDKSNFLNYLIMMDARFSSGEKIGWSIMIKAYKK